MKLTFKKLRENAIIPARATAGSAGLDLCACIDEPLVVPAGEIKIVPTGLAASPEREDVALLVFPRSGLSSKYGISLANSVGLVDSDYRGEICVPLINHSDRDFVVEPDMRIAQLVISPVIFPEVEESSSLDETSRGCGGFGSTGLN